MSTPSTEHVHLGDTVQHVITGFTGVIIARTEWLNGCVRMVILPETLDDKGGIKKSETIDIEELTLIKAKVVPEPEQKKGGPRPDAENYQDPIR